VISRVRMLIVASIAGLGALLGGVGLAQASAATVSTGGVLETKLHGATVEGSVSLEGATPLEECVFEYTVANSSGPALTKPCEGAITSEPSTVTAKLEGLEPEVSYSYKLVLKAEGQKVEGGVGEFKTTQRATVTTEGQSGITSNSATLDGTITPHVETGKKVEYYFEYGKEVSEHKTEPALEATGEEEVSIPVAIPVIGLESHTEYHYRLVAVVEGHVIPAEGEQIFSTTTAKPIVLSSSAGTPTRTTATISGEINPENDETGYNIEYEAQGAHALSSSLAHIAGSAGPAAKIVQTLEELKPATIYHYRIVANNGAGTTVGGEGAFTTGPAQPASVESESAQVTSQTTAAVTAKVNPNGLPTIYALEVGTEVKEGIPLYIPQSFGQVGEDGKLTLALTNLLPGVTYHYRIVATNEEGEVPGADATFTTPSFASPIVEPPHPLLVPAPPAEAEEKTHPVREETRSQKLAKALHQCTRQPKKKRASCRRKAEKRYGAVKKK
jgi:phosphodiesterase/alkaline phosphatase D-like protein